MTELLREELHRLGDQAPPLATPPGLWRRGRRARLRDRALTAATAFATLALVGGAAWVGLGGEHRAAPADGTGPATSGLGVPSTIWAVPSRTGWETSDTSVNVEDQARAEPPGRAAAAYVSDGGQPVVVSADDGSYRLLEGLPDLAPARAYYDTFLADDPWLALSPDGRKLAYAWGDPTRRSPRSAVPAGIDILDLETGEVVRHPLAGVARLALTWSPDSSWLGFVGIRPRSWTDSRMSGGPGLVGRALASSPTQEWVTWRDPVAGLAIQSDGRLVISDGRSALSTWAGGDPARTPVAAVDGRNVSALASLSPDQRLLLWRTRTQVDSLTYLDRDSGSVGTVPIPPGSYPYGADVRPLGWLDETHAVVELTHYVNESSSDGRAIAVVTVDPSAPVESELEIVGREDPINLSDHSDINFLSLATDLMTPERPTVQRQAPDWPWSAERMWAVWGGAAAFLGAALLVVRRFVRRRRPLP